MTKFGEVPTEVEDAFFKEYRLKVKDYRARLMGMFVYLADRLIDDIEWPPDIEKVEVTITMKDGRKHEAWVRP